MPEVPGHPGQADLDESYDDGQFARTKNNPLQNPTIVGSRSEYVALPPLAPSDEVSQASASIIDVQDCTLDICARSLCKSPLAKLQISNARQSLVLCGRVDGSVLFSESQDCVLLVTSGQMRLYKCKNCVVYLHCTSKPIIELSHDIKFAPLPEIFVSHPLYGVYSSPLQDDSDCIPSLPSRSATPVSHETDTRPAMYAFTAPEVKHLGSG